MTWPQGDPGHQGPVGGAQARADPRSGLPLSEGLPLPFPRRACASSETESEAGDLMDQQFEEMSNKLNSVTDPTGFLRMVRRNNLFNRRVWALPAGGARCPGCR